jgi:toxin ParE1/3/4
MPFVRRTSLAEIDLIEIGEWIAGDNPPAADRLLDELEECFQLLATRPAMGTPRHDLSPHVRFYPVGNYLVFYTADRDGITVVRVLHGLETIDASFSSFALFGSLTLPDQLSCASTSYQAQFRELELRRIAAFDAA